MLDPRRRPCNGLSRISITTTRRGPQNENGRRLAARVALASAKGRRKNVCRVPARAGPPGLPFFAAFRGVLANEKTMPFRGMALNAGFSRVQHDSRRIRPPLSEGLGGVGLPTCARGYIAGFSRAGVSSVGQWVWRVLVSSASPGPRRRMCNGLSCTHTAHAARAHDARRDGSRDDTTSMRRRDTPRHDATAHEQTTRATRDDAKA